MADIRCITKTGKERWLPEKLARDKKFLALMELTVQDLEEDKKKVEAIIKPEPVKEVVKDDNGIEAIVTPKEKVKTEKK